MALKLAAWLDRSPTGQYKDATDLAAAMYWYAESREITDRLFSSSSGTEVLTLYEVDSRLAAAHLLGHDVRELIGPTRLGELSGRWPGERGAILPAELALRHAAGWPDRVTARGDILAAFERGLGLVGSS